MVALAMRSGSGILEHPKDDEQSDAVSIWRLPILQLTQQIPGMRLVHLAQGLFGAASPKPTTLLVLGLQDLESQLHRGMLCKTLPFGVSTGRSETGHFNTAPLKEYPPGLCQALAHSFTTDFCPCTDGVCMDCDALPNVPQSFLNLCEHMRDRDFGRYIGRD